MQFDVLYQELARGAEVIKVLVSGITSEEARIKPSPDEWSVLEVIYHLCDEERWDFRQHLDHILHRLDQPWPPKVPVGWETARLNNERDLTKSVDEFLAERKRSLAWLKALSSPDWETSVIAPLGHQDDQIRVKAGDMLTSWVAHDNLHMRQLVELRRARVMRMVEPYDVEYAGSW